MIMQEASNLAYQCDRLWYVPQRACGIEKLALQLRWDRTPMHHDGRAEAPQNMLLDTALLSSGFASCE